LALEFDAVDQVNGHWHMLAAQSVEEGVLQKLPFVVHDILRVLNCFKGFTLTHRQAQIGQSLLKTQTNQFESLSA
jgi:hypothetical protein